MNKEIILILKTQSVILKFLIPRCNPLHKDIQEELASYNEECLKILKKYERRLDA